MLEINAGLRMRTFTKHNLQEYQIHNYIDRLGNSIVVNVLEYILDELFYEETLEKCA